MQHPAPARPSCPPLNATVPEVPRGVARPRGRWVAYRHHLGCEWEGLPALVRVQIRLDGLVASAGPNLVEASLELDRYRFEPEQRRPGRQGLGTREQARAVEIVQSLLGRVRSYRYDPEHCGATAHCLIWLDAGGMPLLSLRGSSEHDPAAPPPPMGVAPPAGGEPLSTSEVRCEAEQTTLDLTTIAALAPSRSWIARRHNLGCRWRPLPADVEIELSPPYESARVSVRGRPPPIELCVGRACDPPAREPLAPELLLVESALRLVSHATYRGGCLILTSGRTPLLELARAGGEEECRDENPPGPK